jgi:hypothetical protein
MGADHKQVAAQCETRESKRSALSNRHSAFSQGNWQMAISQILFTAKVAKEATKKGELFFAAGS